MTKTSTLSTLCLQHY